MKHVERKAWAKVNYSRPECLEVPGIRETLNKKTFKKTARDVFKGNSAHIDSITVADFHRLKASGTKK